MKEYLNIVCFVECFCLNILEVSMLPTEGTYSSFGSYCCKLNKKTSLLSIKFIRLGIAYFPDLYPVYVLIYPVYMCAFTPHRAAPYPDLVQLIPRQGPI